MCGRFHIDDEMLREIRKVIRQLDQSTEVGTWNRDIHPSEYAPVLCVGDLTAKGPAGARDRLYLERGRWGFPGIQKGSVIFNARSETALEKPMFKDSVRQRRAVIPAAWFYEWSREKEKYSFYREESPVIYMAGFLKAFEDGDHFVILTTAANESMSPVHDRMPLVLEAGELYDWVWDAQRAEEILKNKPAPLSKRTDYEQQVLPFL